jgi:hypothetical protein
MAECVETIDISTLIEDSLNALTPNRCVNRLHCTSALVYHC